MAVLNLTTQKQELSSVIENVTDTWGIAEDHNIYEISLTKGHKYTFELELSSMYKDLQGIDIFNKVNIVIKDSNSTILKDTDGLEIDTNIAGRTFISFVAQADTTYTVDVFGSAGYANTTEYSESDRIETPFTLYSQDLGKVDNYEDSKSLATNIDISSFSADGLQTATLSDTSIYDSMRDSDWFSFVAVAGTDYKVTVKTTDGVYKRIDMQSETGWDWLTGDKQVVAGKDNQYTEQYYYLAAEDKTMTFGVTGGKGDYVVTIEEAIIDGEENNAAAANVLTMTTDTVDNTYNANLYAAVDFDFFKLDSLIAGDTYKVTIMTDQLNSNTENNDYGLSVHTNTSGTATNDGVVPTYTWEWGTSAYSVDIVGGKEFYFTADDADQYIKLETWWYQDVKGDYTIKYEHTDDESVGSINDIVDSKHVEVSLIDTQDSIDKGLNVHDTMSITINTKVFTYDVSKGIQSISQAKIALAEIINEDSDLNASFNTTTDKLSVSSETNAAINISDYLVEDIVADNSIGKSLVFTSDTNVSTATITDTVHDVLYYGEVLSLSVTYGTFTYAVTTPTATYEDALTEIVFKLNRDLSPDTATLDGRTITLNTSDYLIDGFTFTGNSTPVDADRTTSISTPVVYDADTINEQTLALDEIKTVISHYGDKDYFMVNLDTAGLYIFQTTDYHTKLTLFNKDSITVNEQTDISSPNTIDTSTYTVGQLSTSNIWNNDPANRTDSASEDGNFGDQNYSRGEYWELGVEDYEGYLVFEVTEDRVGEYYLEVSNPLDTMNAGYVGPIAKVDIGYKFLALDDIGDGGDIKEDATTVEIGTKYTSQIDTRDDVDFFKVELKAGETYKFDFGSNQIKNLDLTLINAASGESLYNNNEASAGLTAVFNRVYEAAGSNMQKAMDFLETYDLDEYKTLMSKVKDDYTSITPKEREDFALYTNLLDEMKKQFNNNDLNIKLTDVDGNIYGNSLILEGEPGYEYPGTATANITMDDLNTKFIFSDDSADMQLTDSSLNSSFHEYMDDLISFAKTLQENTILSQNITERIIELNQKPSATIDIVKMDESELSTITPDKDTLITSLNDKTYFALKANMTLDDRIEFMDNIDTNDYSNTSLEDLIYINKIISEVANELIGYNPDSYETATNVQLGRTETGLVDLINTSSASINNLITSSSSQLEIATAINEITYFKTALEDINKELIVDMSPYEYNTLNKDAIAATSIATISSTQQSELNDLIARLDTSFATQMNSFNVSNYTNTTYSQLKDEIQQLDKAYSVIDMTSMDVSNKNALIVAIEDRKANLINLITPDMISSALTEYTTVLSSNLTGNNVSLITGYEFVRNVDDTAWIKNDIYTDYALKNQTYKDAEADFNTLKNILNLVDTNALSEYKDTYVTDLFSSANATQFEALIDAKHGASWYAHGDAAETFAVREDGTYYVQFNLENTYTYNVGEYDFEISSLNTSDAGDTLEMSFDFKVADLEDYSAENESATTHSMDNAVQGIFTSLDDKDMYSYTFEADQEYRISLDYNGNSAIMKLYDSAGERIQSSYRDGSILTGSSFNPTQSGVYYIETSAKYSIRDGGEYTLKIEDVNAKDAIGSNIKTAGNYLEVLQNSSKENFKLDFDKDVDWFKIDTTYGTNYKIEVDSSSMKFLDIKVFNEFGKEVVDNALIKSIFHEHVSDVGNGYNYITRDWDSDKDMSINLFAGLYQDRETNELTTGQTFYIQVKNNSETGSYDLDVAIDTTADDYGSSMDSTANFRELAGDNNTISGSFEKKKDDDWFSFKWEKAVYEVVIDSSVEKIDLALIFDLGGEIYNVNSYFNVVENFAANIDGDIHYLITADLRYQFFEDAVLSIKNIYGAGDYDLTINKIADIDDTPNDIVLTGGLYTKNDAISYQTDKSIYTLNAVADKSYQIELSASDTEELGQLLLEVKDAKGNIVDILKAWNPSDDDDTDSVTLMTQAIFTPTVAGNYSIEVKTADKTKTGAFDFSIEELDLSGDIGSTLTNHGNFNALAEGGIVSSDLNPSIDKDWFKYSFAEGTQYLISVEMTNSDTGLVHIYDSEGKLYKTDQMWDTTDSLSTSDKTILFNPSEDGDFYLEVADATAGNYTLKVETYTDMADILATLGTQSSVTVDDATGVTSLIDNKDDKDWIKVILEEGKVYKIQTTPSGDKMPIPLDLVINGIFDSSGTLIEGSTSTNGIQYIKPTTGGIYYIEVAGKNDTLGFYDIKVTQDITDDDKVIDGVTIENHTINTDQLVTIGETYKGNIDYLFDKDWIKVTLEAGKRYDIEMKGDSLKNTYITGIFNADGTILQTPISDSDQVTTYSNNDANNYTLDSKITLDLTGVTEDLEYFIEASGYGDLKGSYTIDVTENSDEVSENLSESALSDINNTTATAIEGTLGRYKYGEINHGNDTDLFAYEFEAGVTYEINMYGSDSNLGTLANSWIKSVQFGGSEIVGASNAHGGDGNDSYLTFTAENTGTHYIETASQYNTEGSFKLKVKEEGELSGVTPIGDGSHTIMMYIGADNNLEGNLVDFLLDMQLGDLPEGWNVTFLIDRAEGHDSSLGDWTDTRQGLITFADETNEDIAQTEFISSMESLGELNTGDGDTLTNFINWSSQMAEADSYSLMIFDHGGGTVGSVWDDTNGNDNLGIAELTEAIEASVVHTNALNEVDENGAAAPDKAFEMVGFITCLQGVIDQQYALAGVTDVVFASEEVAWTNFWDFSDWFDGIGEVYDNTGVVTGANMAEVFVDQIANNVGMTQDMTYSAVYTEALDEVVEAVAAMNLEFANVSAEDQQRIKDGSESVVIFSNETQMDLGAFANMIDELDISATMDTKAQAVKIAVADAVIANTTNMSGNGGDAMGIAIQYGGGEANTDYMDNFELASMMNMHEFFEVV